MTYATDGKCHNANRGTFNHECCAPATWIGTKSTGFRSGFCDRCKAEGDERHDVQTWEAYAPHPEALPLFPSFEARPAESALERRIECLVNAADRALMAGRVTQAEYDLWSRNLDRWGSAVLIQNPFYVR